MQLLLAPVGSTGDDRDEAVALEGEDVAAEGRAIHDQVSREGVDSQGAMALEAAQDRDLGGAQSGGRQAVVVELAHVAGGLAERQAAALSKGGRRAGGRS